MLKANLSRLLVGAALVAGAAALYADDAAADRRIVIGAGGSSAVCNSGGNMFMAEALGKDGFNNVVCQAWSQGGTAVSQCPFTVTKHQARITQRTTSTAQLIFPVIQTSPEQLTWGATSSAITHNIPAGPNCAGTFITAVSAGREVP